MRIRAQLNRILRRIPDRPDEAVLVYYFGESEPNELISTLHGSWHRKDPDDPLPEWFTNPPKDIRRIVRRIG